MKTILNFIYVQALCLVLLTPGLIFAAGVGIDTSDSTGVGLKNPLGDKDLLDFFKDILDVLLIFALPIIVFFIIYAGFKYVMARGNESEVTVAHRALLYAVIGGVIILGANVILEVIKGTIDAFK